MELFRADGHLTGGALAALCADAELDGLSRLEIAEHLSFCDLCLERYTDALTGTAPAVPVNSCQKRFWHTARLRKLRMTLSRYAAAAAAVALALTMLWRGDAMELSRYEETRAPSAVAESLRSWPERCNDTLNQAMSGLGDWIGGFDPFQ